MPGARPESRGSRRGVAGGSEHVDGAVHGAERLLARLLDLPEERQQLLRPVRADHLRRLGEHHDGRDVMGGEVMQVSGEFETLVPPRLVHRADPAGFQRTQPSTRGSRGDRPERDERALRGGVHSGRRNVQAKQRG